MDKLDQVLEKMKLLKKESPKSVSNVIPLFKNKPLPLSRLQSFIMPMKKQKKPESATILLQMLVFLMSYFLITETARFFESTDGSMFSGYLKAFILEGIVIAFTVMKARSTALNVVYKGLIVLTYLFSAWAISGSVIQSSMSKEAEFRMNQVVHQELEAEVAKIKERQERFFKEDRVTLARKYDQVLDLKQAKLDHVRQAMLQNPSTSVIWNTLALVVIFRLIVMLSNILCVGYLSKKSQV